ncbi:MAG: RNA polymerase sigma factor [Candidatus Cloacimonadota bacterium]|nr:MAG: RNA polymerase sigma factor [Candidatus Cloacimonadota bacterium]
MSINKERKVEETFEKLVMNHYRRVFNYIYTLVNDYELSKDLTQDTFMKAYLSFKRLRNKESFPIWIMRVARNLSINRMKKEHLKKMRFVSLFTKRYDKELVNSIGDPGVPLEERVKKDEEESLVKKALYEIPSRMREVLILKEWEDLSYEEIGRIMKISRKAVKSLIHRARQKMKKRLEKEDAFK